MEASPEATAELTVDTSRWPLVVLTYAGDPTVEQLSAHLREIEERVLARRQPFVQVVDLAASVMPDALKRALIAEHQLKMDELYGRYCLGEAYVVTEDARGAMTAVFWQAEPPYPYTFVDHLDAAMAWARQRFAEA